MKRRWAWIALLAALAGSPLRQAEAAEDLARSLAEAARRQGVEAVDGGVGDEADVATWKAPGPLAAGAGATPAPEPLTWCDAGAAGGTSVCAGEPAASGPAPPRPVPEAARRRAGLQVYRF